MLEQHCRFKVTYVIKIALFKVVTMSSLGKIFYFLKMWKFAIDLEHWNWNWPLKIEDLWLILSWYIMAKWFWPHFSNNPNLSKMIGTFEVKLTIEVEPFLLKRLELRQFKQDSTEPKNRIVLKLPPFFPFCLGEWKAWQFQN